MPFGNALLLVMKASNASLLYMVFYCIWGIKPCLVLLWFQKLGQCFHVVHCMVPVLHLLAATWFIFTNREASVTTTVLSNIDILGKYCYISM